MNDVNKQGQKVFIFPENIKSHYSVIFGLTLKEILLFVLPAMLVGIVILVIPPYNVTSFMIKIFFAVLIVTITIAVITTSPVKYRENIKLLPYLKLKRGYSKRQQLYFKDTRKGGKL